MEVTYSIRFYRGAEFCRLDIGINSEQAAVEDACDEIAGGCGTYDRAEITHNRQVIGHVNNKLEYTACSTHS